MICGHDVIDIVNPEHAQDAFISAMQVSSIRLEKPHSLSYQEQTLTVLPLTTRVMAQS